MPTPLRNVRVSDDVWNAAKARAAVEGVTLASVLTDALEAYGSGQAAPTGQRVAVPTDVVVPTDVATVPTAPGPKVAAPKRQRGGEPAPKRGSCSHANMRIRKGVCPDCYEWVSGK